MRQHSCRSKSARPAAECHLFLRHKLDVPPLRQLRHLPHGCAVEQAAAASSGARGKGVIAASLIVVAALAGRERLELVHDPTRFPNSIRRHDARCRGATLKKPTAARCWNAWIEYYRPLAERGFSMFEAGQSSRRSNRKSRVGVCAEDVLDRRRNLLRPSPRTSLLARPETTSDTGGKETRRRRFDRSLRSPGLAVYFPA